MNSSRRPASLALRVTVFVGVAISLCLLALGWIVQRSIENHFAIQDAAELQVVAESVRKTLIHFGADDTALPGALVHAVAGHHGVYFQVNNADGTLVYASPGPDLSVIAAGRKPASRVQDNALFGWEQGENNYRGTALKVPIELPSGTRNYHVIVASSMDFHLNYLASFRWTLWAIMAGACAFTVLAAWLAVKQGHALLHQVSGEIRSISSDQLHLRLQPQSVPIELLELVTSFNHMMARMEEVFERLSNFSADIAHEMRTPLTNLITQTQVALGQARTLDEYRELLYSNLEEQERLAKMVNDMLWLAKTDNGLLKPTFVEMDLATEVRELFDYFEAWAEEKNVALVLEGQTTSVSGDRSMLRRALSNLLSNAIRHTTPTGAVRVTLESSPERGAVVVVSNPGPAIPIEHLSKIFDRFYRIDPSRQRQSDGAGLGLAIVKSIVEAHGGQVAARSDQMATIFELTLPTSLK